MSIPPICAVIILWSSALLAEDPGISSALPISPVSSAAMVSTSSLTKASMPHGSRAVVLFVGLAAVAVTFHKALTTKKKAY